MRCRLLQDKYLRDSFYDIHLTHPKFSFHRKLASTLYLKCFLLKKDLACFLDKESPIVKKKLSLLIKKHYKLYNFRITWVVTPNAQTNIAMMLIKNMRSRIILLIITSLGPRDLKTTETCNSRIYQMNKSIHKINLKNKIVYNMFLSVIY